MSPNPKHMKPSAKSSGASRLAWGLSVLLHAVVAGAFLISSQLNQSAPAQINDPPEAWLEYPVETLQLEPLSKDMRLEPVGPDEMFSDNTELPRELLDLPDLPATEGFLSAAGSARGLVDLNPPFAGPPLGNHPNAAFGTSFCSIHATAQRICYVIDFSASMIIASQYVRDQLRLSIEKLSPAQSFQIVFNVNAQPKPLPPGGLLRATGQNRKEAIRFISSVEPSGISDISAALTTAFNTTNENALRCDLIYLLTDGQFNSEQLSQTAQKLQAGRDKIIPIAVILCGATDDTPLRQFARQNKGQFRQIPDEKLDEAILNKAHE